MRIQKPPTDDFAATKLDLLPSLTDVIRAANKEYYHWDKFRRRPLPKGTSHADAWALIRLFRQPTFLPFTDSVGKPFGCWIPDSCLHQLHLIDRNAGDLISFSGPAEGVRQAKQRILTDSHMDEAIATNQIEGAVTTRRIALELLRSGNPPTDQSQRMIVNGYQTIRLLSQLAKRPMSLDILFEVQRTITQGTLENPDHAGRFRNVDDGPVEVVDVRTNEVVFSPPPVSMLSDRMRRLVDFANTPPESEPFIHPVIRAAILHYWLAYEHPFTDGNGRTARALFYWYMLRSGYWLFEFLTVSRVIHASRMDYYRAFQYVQTDHNDLTYFIVYLLRATLSAIEELRDRVEATAAEQADIASIAGTRGLNSRQRSLLATALREPALIHTFESHHRTQGVTLLTARNDILGLVERGFLTEVGGRRPREFAPPRKLEAKLRRGK